jgi:hypothetical protein
MNKFAVAARNVLLCALVTIPLAACGGSDGGSAAATASTSATADTQAALQANVGMIDRSQTDASVNAASVATSSAPVTAAATNTSASGSSNTASTGSGSTSGSAASGSTSSGTTASAGTVAKTTPPVAPTSTTDGVATLDWQPPTSNTDGSALTNLAGYTVYYGTSPDNLSKSIKVSNAGLSAYTVTGLTSGTWYFAVTSYSADGVESARTTTVHTQI